MSRHRFDPEMPNAPVLIEAPEGDFISLADCKKVLGVTGTDQDVVIGAALGAATDALDAATNGTLGRALREQTWELQLNSFEQGWVHRPRHYTCHAQAIALPYPPLLKVLSVKYVDPSGVDRSLSLGADYRVLRQGAIDGKQLIEPAFGKAWPAARFDTASVRVQYSCGYDGDDNVAPRQLITAVCLGVRALLAASTRDPMLFEDRVEGIGSQRFQVDGTKAVALVTSAADELLSRLRVF